MPYFTSYDRTRLSYHRIGKGPPLVCLSGGPGSDSRTLGDLGGLDQRRTLILLDARASGHSEIPENKASCSYTEQVKDLEVLRQLLKVDRLDILAHSAGALTAQHYAAIHGEHMGKLILVTPAGRIAREVDTSEVKALRTHRAAETWYPAAIEAWQLLISGATNTENSQDIESCMAPFLYGVWTPAAQQHYHGDYITPPDWLFEAYYVGSPTSPFDMAKRLAMLKSVKSQILILAGAEDCIAGTEAARLTASTYDMAQLEILPGVSHHPWIDNPDLFQTIISKFLNEDH